MPGKIRSASEWYYWIALIWTSTAIGFWWSWLVEKTLKFSAAAYKKSSNLQLHDSMLRGTQYTFFSNRGIFQKSKNWSTFVDYRFLLLNFFSNVGIHIYVALLISWDSWFKMARLLSNVAANCKHCHVMQPSRIHNYVAASTVPLKKYKMRRNKQVIYTSQWFPLVDAITCARCEKEEEIF